MIPPFKDYFSAHASAYARYRPGYPDALFAYVASRCTNRALAECRLESTRQPPHPAEETLHAV